MNTRLLYTDRPTKLRLVSAHKNVKAQTLVRELKAIVKRLDLRLMKGGRHV